MTKSFYSLTASIAVSALAQTASAETTYSIVDTAQGTCFDSSISTDCPAIGAAFYGQDAQYTGTSPSYTDNGDGTVADNVTGLI